MIHKREKLTEGERAAQRCFGASLNIRQRKTEWSVIVAIVGLVGSGKSTVARRLADDIGATIIEGDEIRNALREQGGRYEKARAIAENAALEVVRLGSNAVLDSDFIDPKKRASIREKARKAGVRLEFICTYCELDVMIKRIIANDLGEFFNQASSQSGLPAGSVENGWVVKLREMIRRLPHHYRWLNRGGGKWEIRKPPCKVLADIDTTDPVQMRRQVEDCAKMLIKQ